MTSFEGVDVGITVRASAEVESFGEFYRSQYHPAVALAFAITGDRAAAEDITQEAFITAQKRWDRIAQYDAPHAWLRRVVTNRSISRIRRRHSETNAVIRLAAEPRGERGNALSAETVELWEAVRSLPRRQAQVVALTYLEGYTIPEVAEILGCRGTTAKTHLQRAKQSLAQKLQLVEEEA
ncbi:MAG: sigma-70 family RNA polymerase sigma factor [Acidimicrobiia bacterium]|nr:sigma-70 family RNA polymerase sigma factor [Acidimicrobiia bacterium]